MFVDHVGPAPASTRWTVLCLDMMQILNIYLNRRYSYLKSIRLCANICVRSLFTSDTLYQPGFCLLQLFYPDFLVLGRVAPTNLSEVLLKSRCKCS